MNQNTPKFEKQLKRNDITSNVVRQMKLLKARCKDFHLKVKEIDKFVFDKFLFLFENLDTDKSTNLLIKECYQRNYQNEEMKSRDIFTNKLDELKKT